MSETQLPQQTREALAKPPHQRGWDGMAAVIAALVGLLALCISGYTAYLQRQQIRAQVWPYLETGVSRSARDVTLINKGIGPAIIRGVQLYVDGNAQMNWKDAFTAAGLVYDHHIPYSTIHGRVVSSGEKITQLAFPSDDDFARFIERGERFKLRICYCSALAECWQYDDANVKTNLVTSIKECPAASADDFTQ